jgi:ABC-type multidrug transport system permease subunit
MRGFVALVAKDLRLLWRDRAGLIFLTLAPIVVITVAGFSLANLYGADPTGQTAYELPLVDEDGGALGRTLRERLAADPSVHLVEVASRDAARALVDTKHAGSALVIPRGTDAALDAGEAASLVLYVDPVKYLERLNVRIRLLELRETFERERASRIAAHAGADVERLRSELQRLADESRQARDRLDASWADAARTRADAEARVTAELTRAHDRLAAAIAHQVDEAGRSLDAALEPLHAYLDTLAAKRGELEAWVAELRRLAGSHAGDIPPPPTFPDPPAALSRLVTLPRPQVTLPALPPITLPPLPPMPHLELPDVPLPALPPASAARLDVEEVSVTAGGTHINTFDQNVPGFSVTFLLLGMLLGISLSLLDERDWGTLDRLRTMPVSLAHVLTAKLVARFAIGVAQMIVLLLVGKVAFGVSLGPSPWALGLPIAGIVFAGTAFGLVVAAIAPTREAVLPVGSIVIVTMAAVGGCWWPIDLEPRWMRDVALAFPTTWAMDAFNDLMIRRRGASVALVPTAVMLAYGTAYLVLGTLLFRRRLASSSGAR